MFFGPGKSSEGSEENNGVLSEKKSVRFTAEAGSIANISLVACEYSIDAIDGHLGADGGETSTHFLARKKKRRNHVRRGWLKGLRIFFCQGFPFLLGAG